jgi:hypothetical protein
MYVRTRSIMLSAVALLVVSAGAEAQVQTQEKAAGTTSRLITNADVKAWNSIRGSALSNDGKWFAYVVGPQEGDLTVVVRGTAQNATEQRIPVGGSGGSISISGGWATSSRRRVRRRVALAVAVGQRRHRAQPRQRRQRAQTVRARRVSSSTSSF